MSDPRFARLKTDPRFRRIRKSDSKVTVDERFKGIFDQEKKKAKTATSRVDKYGRPVSDDHERDNLRRFYRLQNEEESTSAPDLARGEVLLESSDEEDPEQEPGTDDDEDMVTLGLHQSKPIPVADEEPEVDLDEDNFADLDAQAETYAKANENQEVRPPVAVTKRLAVVNLDWDHVKAVHLHKIFSSLVSTTANTLMPSSNGKKKQGGRPPGNSFVRGRVLSVRIYPSEFGQKRMTREEKEGPPAYLFKRSKEIVHEDDVNETNVYEVGEEDDFNEDALRKYQLERLRYYYAIAVCDSPETASQIYSELEGTELERSANVFDMSFVPDDMTFDQDFRDEATEDTTAPLKPLDFTTDALRHSKVKLTWDQDDPERNRFTRRTLSKKEIEEDDFNAYIASSSSGSETEGAGLRYASKLKSKKLAERDKLRALLLGGVQDDLPEGWGKSDEKENPNDLDMEITFTPGLSEIKGDADETTLEKYQRKTREKRKKRKEELKGKSKGEKNVETKGLEDDFFDNGSAASSDDEQGVIRSKGPSGSGAEPAARNSHTKATPEELTLLVPPDNPGGVAKHFDMSAVLKSEMNGRRNRKGKKSKQREMDDEHQEDFAIDVKDDRFNALHEDHAFAIDPSNPHFKKTKSMTALLEERSKRQKSKHDDVGQLTAATLANGDRRQKSLQSLVESVKRKSTTADGQGLGKRRKI